LKTFLIVVLVVVVVGFLLFMIFMKKRKADKRNELPVFFAKKPLTEIEQTMYHRLVEALPEYLVMAQVQVSQIVGIKKGPLWQTWFNKISRKSVDYVICLKDFTIIAVIELDDATHEREDRQKTDGDKDTALMGAGLKIIRWKAKSLPDIQTVRAAVHK